MKLFKKLFKAKTPKPMPKPTASLSFGDTMKSYKQGRQSRQGW